MQNQLTTYLRAGYPGLAVISSEEARAEAEIAAACTSLKRRLHAWSSTEGLDTFIARTIEGNYPNYRQVMPPEFLADATIPETHRLALISWLRSLAGKDGRNSRYKNPVRLTWETPGHLILTLRNSDVTGATIHVPASITGHPPVIAFAPRYLADALVIGSTLRLIDGISPGVVIDPASGNYCLIMPCRYTEVAEEAAEKAGVTQAPAPAKAA